MLATRMRLTGPELLGGYNNTNCILLVHSRGTDGSQVFVDSSIGGNSGSGHTITAAGNIHHETSKPGITGVSMIQLDGAGDYATIPNSSDFSLGSGDFTLTAGVAFTETRQQAIINRWNYVAGKRSWTLCISYYSAVPGHVEFLYSTDGAPALYYLKSDTVLNDGNRHQIDIVRNGTELFMRVDGTKQIKTLNLGTASIFDPGTETCIGAAAVDHTENFTGYLDEVALWKGQAVFNAASPAMTLPFGPDAR